MIVVMEKGANATQIAHMVERVEGMGLKAHVIHGTERTVIAAIGDKREYMRESLESGPGVSEVVPILAPYKVASCEVKSEPTMVQARDLCVGAGKLGIIAGPCSVEGEEQIVKTAQTGASRGGDWIAWWSLQATYQPVQFSGAQGAWLGTVGDRSRRDRFGGGHRGPCHGGCRTGRFIRRCAASWCAEHAELSSA